MMLTLPQLIRIMPHAQFRASRFIGPLNDAMDECQIDSPKRIAAYLAQIGHESGQLRYVEEIASGAAYDNRKDLGNTRPEAIAIAKRNGTTAGRFYKGHGLIQITGYDNHLAAMLALDIDCVENPQLLCEPVNACRSAAWFWASHGLNELADAGRFKRITKVINGGFNGLADRLALHEVATRVLT